MRHLFIIEGIDGAGKTTQTERLARRLTQENVPCRQIKLPNYGYPACAPVELYLAGEFGSEPSDVNAYTASAFFAVDRFAYYRKFWQDDYLSGKLILSDRYVTSNLIHQCVKLPAQEREPFIRWLYDLEYEKMGIPRPSAVFYLDVPPAFTKTMLTARYGGDEEKKDIHERDVDYLFRCYEMGLECCEKWGFERIPCVENGVLRSVEEIHNDIYRRVAILLSKQGG